MNKMKKIGLGAMLMFVVSASDAVGANKNTWHEMAGHACASSQPGDDVRWSQSGLGNNCNAGGCNKIF